MTENEASSAPFSTSPAYHSMQSCTSKQDQALRQNAITNYFTKKNPKIPLKTLSLYAQLIEATSAKYKLDPFLVAAIMVKESTMRERVVSKGNYGLMQINWNANKSWIKKTFPVRSKDDLLVPANNVKIGAHILAANIRRTGGDVDKGLDRYRGRSLASYRNSVHSHYRAMAEIFKQLKQKV